MSEPFITPRPDATESASTSSRAKLVALSVGTFLVFGVGAGFLVDLLRDEPFRVPVEHGEAIGHQPGENDADPGGRVYQVGRSGRPSPPGEPGVPGVGQAGDGSDVRIPDDFVVPDQEADRLPVVPDDPEAPSAEAGADPEDGIDEGVGQREGAFGGLGVLGPPEGDPLDALDPSDPGNGVFDVPRFVDGCADEGGEGCPAGVGGRIGGDLLLPDLRIISVRHSASAQLDCNEPGAGLGPDRRAMVVATNRPARVQVFLGRQGPPVDGVEPTADLVPDQDVAARWMEEHEAGRSRIARVCVVVPVDAGDGGVDVLVVARDAGDQDWREVVMRPQVVGLETQVTLDPTVASYWMLTVSVPHAREERVFASVVGTVGDDGCGNAADRFPHAVNEVRERTFANEDAFGAASGADLTTEFIWALYETDRGDDAATYDVCLTTLDIGSSTHRDERWHIEMSPRHRFAFSWTGFYVERRQRGTGGCSGFFGCAYEVLTGGHNRVSAGSAPLDPEWTWGLFPNYTWCDHVLLARGGTSGPDSCELPGQALNPRDGGFVPIYAGRRGCVERDGVRDEDCLTSTLIRVQTLRCPDRTCDPGPVRYHTIRVPAEGSDVTASFEVRPVNPDRSGPTVTGPFGR